MFGLTSCLRAANRERMIGLGITAIAGLAILAPSAAHASGCEDSWTNTAGGSWFEGGNWSKGKAPTSEEEACITEPGTYTVTMDQMSTVTVKALAVGGASGTQTLVVASTNGTNAVLTTSAGITNGAHGAITLTNAETNGNNVTIVGPITNAGTMKTEPAHGGQRNLQGNLTNTGTLGIKANTSFNGSKAILANKNAINIASGVQLTASNESSITNSAGTISATETGDVLMEPGTTFTEGAGTTSGTKPVILRQAALKYTGTGKSLITQHGEGSTLSGNLSSGQSLVLELTNGEDEKTTASASFSNAGTITLTKIESNNNNARLAISSGTLTNTGTITSEAAENTGHRYIEGNLKNTGTLNINSDTEFDSTSALLTNEGALNVATGAALFGSSETSVANAAGSINGTGTGAVQMEPGTSFTEGAGTTSGTKPVLLRDAALHYTGSGESKITQHGEGNTLSGNLAAGQSLVLESTNGEHEKTTASESFSNAGSITLTKIEENNNNARLAISSGTLTNTGTITSEAAESTGHRFLEGSITNKGTLNINSDTEYNTKEAALTNEGTLNVAEGATLDASNDGTVTNGADGKIAAGSTGNVVVEPGGTFAEGAGTTSGTKPVILRDAALHYTGTGESKITQHGEGNTLSGNLAAGQSLVLESTNGEHAKTTASASFTNAGSITLTKSETNNNNARLAISSGTLTNSGTITSEAAEGGSHRYIEGSVTNTGTLNIDSDTEYNATSALLTNEGTLNVAEGVALTVSGSGAVANDAGNIATGATGAVLMEPGTSFTQGAGTTSGTLPVIVRDGALAYTGSGASTIAQRGESGTLSGNISSGQSLLIESTNGEHAKTTASASFTNGGTITLTKTESNNNNARLAIASGTLTNSGTITSEAAEGTGHRFIEGNLTNKGTLQINSSTEYNAKGATLTNEGTIDLAEGVTLSVSGSATVINNAGTIAGTGSGALSQSGGTFKNGSGKTTGSEPVILNNVALYPGNGVTTIALRGEKSTLIGTVNSGQILSIQSTCNSHAKTTASASFTNYGTIRLTNGDGCGNNATLDLSGNTLTNKGTVNSANPHGGARTIEGAVTNEGTLSLGGGETLKVTSTYTQTSNGTLQVKVGSATSFGALSVSGSATIAGTLTVIQKAPFEGSLGQTFTILTSASLTGTFAAETGDQIGSTSLYYKPTYSATAVTLVVTKASLVLSAASGLPGSSVTLSGSGYLPGDTITPKFVNHGEVKTFFPSVTTNSSGEFSTEITIPTSAARGAGSIRVKSTQTEVAITKTFTIT